MKKVKAKVKVNFFQREKNYHQEFLNILAEYVSYKRNITASSYGVSRVHISYKAIVSSNEVSFQYNESINVQFQE